MNTVFVKLRIICRSYVENDLENFSHFTWIFYCSKITSEILFFYCYLIFSAPSLFLIQLYEKLHCLLCYQHQRHFCNGCLTGKILYGLDIYSDKFKPVPLNGRVFLLNAVIGATYLFRLCPLKSIKGHKWKSTDEHIN